MIRDEPLNVSSTTINRGLVYSLVSYEGEDLSADGTHEHVHDAPEKWGKDVLKRRHGRMDV